MSEKPINPDISGRSDVGVVRKVNEDNWGMRVPRAGSSDAVFGAMIVVADGVGSLGNGDLASRTVVDTIRSEYYETTNTETDIPKRLTEAIRISSLAVQQRIIDMRSTGGMGSTVAGLLFFPEKRSGYSFNVGDSRVYRKRRGSAAPEQMSLDDVRTGDDSNEEALTQYLGQARELNPRIMPFSDLDSGDIFVICSDGLWKLISLEEIFHIVERASSSEEAVSALIALARGRGAPDNVTAVVARMYQPKRPAPAAGQAQPRRSNIVPLIALVVVVLVIVAVIAAVVLTQNNGGGTSTLPEGTSEATAEVIFNPPTATSAGISLLLTPTASDAPSGTPAPTGAGTTTETAANPRVTQTETTPAVTSASLASASVTAAPLAAQASETPSPTSTSSSTATRIPSATVTASVTPSPNASASLQVVQTRRAMTEAASATEAANQQATAAGALMLTEIANLQTETQAAAQTASAEASAQAAAGITATAQSAAQATAAVRASQTADAAALNSAHETGTAAALSVIATQTSTAATQQAAAAVARITAVIAGTNAALNVAATENAGATATGVSFLAATDVVLTQVQGTLEAMQTSVAASMQTQESAARAATNQANALTQISVTQTAAALATLDSVRMTAVFLMTNTATSTPTVTPTATVTVTPTVTPTITPSVTPSMTPTTTPSATVTPTLTPTTTPTATATASATPTAAATTGATAAPTTAVTASGGESPATPSVGTAVDSMLTPFEMEMEALQTQIAGTNALVQTPLGQTPPGQTPSGETLPAPTETPDITPMPTPDNQQVIQPVQGTFTIADLVKYGRDGGIILQTDAVVKRLSSASNPASGDEILPAGTAIRLLNGELHLLDPAHPAVVYYPIERIDPENVAASGGTPSGDTPYLADTDLSHALPVAPYIVMKQTAYWYTQTDLTCQDCRIGVIAEDETLHVIEFRLVQVSATRQGRWYEVEYPDPRRVIRLGWLPEDSTNLEVRNAGLLAAVVIT